MKIFNSSYKRNCYFATLYPASKGSLVSELSGLANKGASANSVKTLRITMKKVNKPKNAIMGIIANNHIWVLGIFPDFSAFHFLYYMFLF